MGKSGIIFFFHSKAGEEPVPCNILNNNISRKRLLLIGEE